MAKKKINAERTKKAKPAKRKGKSSKASSKPHYVVGIGASAGGLEALRNLFGALKDTNDMAFVVVQHLAPLYQSRLVELIAHSTSIEVREVRDAECPQAGVIYITPPNKDVVIEKGKLRLKKPQMKIGPKPSVDLFMQSLAEDYNECAIGIVLSGTGSDGALGIRAIKAHGGMTIAQKMSSAKYDGMPKAAKLTGAVDMELTPEQIAKELERYKGVRRTLTKDRDTIFRDDPYQEILGIIQKEAGANFAQYKPSTIRRRIERRLLATHSDTLEEYLEVLKKGPDEVKLLFQDILISVTSFFRDVDAFRALEKRLCDRLKQLRAGEQFRCWVIGCATGEEPYSIAILLAEISEKLGKQIAFQIFATDLDEQALAIARKGIYSKASLSEVPKKLREKYFNVIEDRFQIKPAIRDLVIFARHSVNQDPPFLNMGLVSCRNVLIYFGTELQEQVFATVHYALEKSGILFLGKSENVSTTLGLFEVENKSAKLFTRVNRKVELPRAVSSQDSMRKPRAVTKPEEPAFASDYYTSMVTSFAPDSVLIDNNNQIRHIYGEGGRFLNWQRGEATSNITRCLPADLGLELSAILHRIHRDKKLVRGREHELKFDKQHVYCRMVVAPLMTSAAASDGENGKEYLISFETRKVESEARKLGTSQDKHSDADHQSLSEKLAQSQRDLAATQDHLQTVLEEQETASEELQSLNEELQSANEELQSSNEELETANEELQSSNEELTTLNQELNVKSAELLALNHTLQAIQNAIIYPLLVVDKSLRLLHFNPASRYLFRINESDIGHNLKAVATHLELGAVIKKIESTLEGGTETQFQIHERERNFEVQVRLFRGARDSIQGAVISFVDNTEIIRALEESRLIKGRLSDIMDNTPAMVTMKDTMGVYSFVNKRFGELVRTQPKDVMGQTDDEFFGEQFANQLRERDFEVSRIKRPVQSEERMVIGGKEYWWASSRFPLLDSKGRVQSVCTISLDITEQVLRRRQLELFRQALSSVTGGIMLLEGSEKSGFKVGFVSEELGQMTGVKVQTVMGKPLGAALSQVFPKKKGPHGPSAEALAKGIVSNPSLVSTFQLRGEKNEERWVELRSCRLNFGGEQGEAIVVTLFDVTEREQNQRLITQQQEELTRFSRYSALGEIAAGIAHEVNTPLNVITTKTDFLKKLSELKRLEGEKVTKVAGDIDQMAKTISSIVIGLKSLAVSEADKYERVSLNQLIRDTLKVVEFRLQRFGVELHLELPSAEIYADCYPIQLSQILINLINNSIDAISNRMERWICVELSDKNSDVRIRVSDCGEGVPAELAEKIMTPFFTTKKEQNGTGLGLSLSRTIARRHGGDLKVDLKAKNTTFQLDIPKKQQRLS